MPKIDTNFNEISDARFFGKRGTEHVIVQAGRRSPRSPRKEETAVTATALRENPDTPFPACLRQGAADCVRFAMPAGLISENGYNIARQIGVGPNIVNQMSKTIMGFKLPKALKMETKSSKK